MLLRCIKLLIIDMKTTILEKALKHTTYIFLMHITTNFMGNQYSILMLLFFCFCFFSHQALVHKLVTTTDVRTFMASKTFRFLGFLKETNPSSA